MYELSERAACATAMDHSMAVRADHGKVIQCSDRCLFESGEGDDVVHLGVSFADLAVRSLEVESTPRNLAHDPATRIVAPHLLQLRQA
jgi:hypothetical protein